MHPRITLLAALAVATFLTAPAEARRHAAPQRITRAPIIDVAAIPPYPFEAEKTHRAPRRAAARKAKTLRTTRRSPEVRQAPRRPSHELPAGPDLVTVPTAAGIDITCSTSFAPEAVSLIAAAVARGIRFSRITCYSQARSHKKLSNHRTGDAFDSHPSIPARLVRQHDLRSGCDFRDCPHVDNARNVGGVAYWNSVRHPGSVVTASAERRHHRHRRYRVARR